MDSLIKSSSLAGLEPDTISISNVNLSLGTGAARVHISKISACGWPRAKRSA